MVCELSCEIRTYQYRGICSIAFSGDGEWVQLEFFDLEEAQEWGQDRFGR
jgi:hypothetical protein